MKTPPGRSCLFCKKRKPYKAFVPAHARRCVACARAGKRKRYEYTCDVCSKDFNSASQRARYCGDECRAQGLKKRRRAE